MHDFFLLISQIRYSFCLSKGRRDEAASADMLPKDHPGFSDPIYVQRRQMIGEMGKSFSVGDRIPHVECVQPFPTHLLSFFWCVGLSLLLGTQMRRIEYGPY